MNAKFNNRHESFKFPLRSEIISDIKSLDGLKETLETCKKSRKYIVTLRPIIKSSSQKDEGKIRKVIVNAEDILKGKDMLSSKVIFKTQRLEQIAEKAENIASPTEFETFNLKACQSKQNLCRLNAGYRVDGKEQPRDETKEAHEGVATEQEPGLQISPNEFNNSEHLPLLDVKNSSKLNDEPKPKQESSVHFLLKAIETSEADLNQNSSLSINKGANSLNDRYEAEYSATNTKEEATGITVDSSKPINQNEIHKSSSAENLLEEKSQNADHQKFGISSNNYGIRDVVPLNEEPELRQFQIDQLNIKQSDISGLSSSDEVFCQRIENLEKEVNEINLDLKELRKELVPMEDLVKVNALLARFHEVNELIADLKSNGLNFQNMEMPMSPETEQIKPRWNEDMQIISTSLSNCKIFNLDDNRDIPYGQEQHNSMESCNCKIYKKLQPISVGNFQNITKPQRQRFEENTSSTDSEVFTFNSHRYFSRNTQTHRSTSRKTKSKHLRSKFHQKSLPVSKNMCSTLTKVKTVDSAAQVSLNLLLPLDNSKRTDSTTSSNINQIALITKNLRREIFELIGNRSSNSIALTIFSEPNNLYHINVSIFQTGQCLGCIYTNEAALRQAKKRNFFEKFLVFIVLNSDNCLGQRKMLLHDSFQFVLVKD